ncbi:MAG: hypothetical protein HYZ75_05365 [Elusimicrobia bacterium]|nr:hypothetical protein [Elusimicrobiota bacterium]
MTGALAETVAYLASPEARAAITRDPYWPKWDSPWWRMTLLWELGEAARIPSAIAGALTEAVDRHYLRVFPFSEGELPPGKSLQRDVACHCALGTVWQVLAACGIDVDARLPWVRPWFLRYRLLDGGWNCDEAAYLKPTPRSSVVSTVPVLEALLGLRSRTAEEEAALDAGASYLLERRLFRSLSKGGAVIDPVWLRLTFPRFYEYDVLRGLAFVSAWSRLRGREAPDMAEATAAIRAHETPEGLASARRAWEGVKTLRPAADATWERGDAAPFALLAEVGRPGVAEPALTRSWAALRGSLRRGSGS